MEPKEVPLCESAVVVIIAAASIIQIPGVIIPRPAQNASRSANTTITSSGEKMIQKSWRIAARLHANGLQIIQAI